jgi:hypothetical protein
MRLLPINVHTQDGLKTSKDFPWKNGPNLLDFEKKKKKKKGS